MNDTSDKRLRKPSTQMPLDTDPPESVRVQRWAQSWEGPLPPPTVFEAYEQVMKGCAPRILRMAETEQENRHKTYARGQRFAFILGLFGMASGTYLIAIDKSVAALIPLVAALVPLLGGFLGRLLESRVIAKAEGETTGRNRPPPE